MRGNDRHAHEAEGAHLAPLTPLTRATHARTCIRRACAQHRLRHAPQERSAYRVRHVTKAAYTAVRAACTRGPARRCGRSGRSSPNARAADTGICGRTDSCDSAPTARDGCSTLLGQPIDDSQQRNPTAHPGTALTSNPPATAPPARSADPNQPAPSANNNTNPNQNLNPTARSMSVITIDPKNWR